MAKKSQGYIWLKKTALDKATHQKENWAGKRIAELVTLLDLKDGKELMTRVRVNEKPLTKWQLFKKLKQGDTVDLLCRPEGDDTFGIIINVVLIVVGILIIVGTLGGGAAAGWGLIAAGVTGLAGIFLAPSLRTPRRVDDSASQRPEITGASNQISTSIIPVLFGTTQFTPYYGQNFFRWTGDGTPINILNQYFIPTYKNINISGEKLGTTPIDDYEGNVVTTKSFGGEDFIGFENIYPVAKDEQLTIDETSTTNDIIYSTGSYDGVTAIQLSLEYTVLNDINNFTDKTIRVSGVSSGAFTEVTIQSTDLVDNGTFYSVAVPSFNITLTNERVKFENTVVTQQSADEIAEDMRGTLALAVFGAITENYNADFDKLENQPNFIVDSTPDNTNSIEWIFEFPQGLYRQNSNGSKSSRAKKAKCRYKIFEAVGYNDLDDATAIYTRDSSGNKMYLTASGTVYSNPLTTTTYDSSTNDITLLSPDDNAIIDELFFRNIGIEISSDKYTYNVSSSGFVGGKTSSDVGVMQLSDVFSVIDGNPLNIALLTDLTQVKVVAKAYKNLSGTLQQYNFIAKVEVPTWDGNDWDAVAESTNPAAVVRYLLTDPLANPRAEEVSALDNDSFTEFYDYCVTEGFHASGAVSSPSKVIATIQTILSNCQSTIVYIEGKIAIATDKDKVVKEMVTPHNSWDMESTYSIGRKINALRFNYVNNTDYKDTEFTRYYYNGTTNATPEEGKSDSDYDLVKKEIDYATDTTHVTKNADYQLKTIQERVVEFEFKVNLESLGMGIYDRVLVSNTSGMNSQYSGRINTVNRNGSGFITGFTLDSYVTLEVPKNGDDFKIYIRSIEDLGGGEGKFTITSLDINEKNGRFIELTLLTPYDDSAIVQGKGDIEGETSTWYYDGDLFDINDASIHDCVITDVRPERDLTATVVALETPQEFWS